MLHRAVGEALERLYPDRLEELYGLLAYHYQRAEVNDKAFEYLIKAAEQARSRYANEDVIRFYIEALMLTPETDDARRYSILLAREKVYDVHGVREAQARDLDMLTTLAEKLIDDRRRAEVALRRANFAQMTGDYPTAIAPAQQAVALAQTAGVVESEAAGYMRGRRALMRQADYVAAHAQLERALTLARAARLPGMEADSTRMGPCDARFWKTCPAIGN